MKTSCPHCQQHVEADDQWAGQVVACPTCNGQILLSTEASPPPLTGPPLPKAERVASPNPTKTIATIKLEQREDGKFTCPARVCIRCGEPATNTSDLMFHKESQWWTFFKGRALADVGTNAVLVRAPFCKRHKYYSYWPFLLFATGSGLLVAGLLIGGLLLLFVSSGGSKSPGEDMTIGLVTLAIGVTVGPILLYRLPRSVIWQQEVTDTSITITGVSQAFVDQMHAPSPSALSVEQAGQQPPLAAPALQKKISVGILSACLAALAAVCFVFVHNERSPFRAISVAVFLPSLFVGPGCCIAAFIRKDKPVLAGISLVGFIVLFVMFFSSIK